MLKTIPAKHSIHFGSREIKFSLEYLSRKTLGIAVLPDKTVKVSAPLNTTIEKIEQKIRKRAPWIIKQQDFFLSFEPKTPPRRYVGGESHLYLGRKYRLKLIETEEEKVKLLRGYLVIYTKDKKNKTQIQKLVYRWYKDRATVKFIEYLENCLKWFNSYDISYEKLVIRKLEKRWGSCTPNGKILLNTDLIQAPKGCIEYVIVHELCHLIYPNHNRKFYALQEQILPKWLVWKERLEEVMA